MSFELPELPFSYDALEPEMSRETLQYHHDKHHRAYVDKTNKLIAGTEFEDLPLEEIVRQASGPIYNNAAQIWNHNFFWNCLQTPQTSLPGKALATAITRNFGSLDDFKTHFTKSATELFGSGWVWLVRKDDGSLAISATQGAGNPLTQDETPLLVCDVWEHAYYIDYRNDRATFIGSFWRLVNWQFVEENLENASPSQRRKPAIALPEGARL